MESMNGPHRKNSEMFALSSASATSIVNLFPISLTLHDLSLTSPRKMFPSSGHNPKKMLFAKLKKPSAPPLSFATLILNNNLP